LLWLADRYGEASKAPPPPFVIELETAGNALIGFSSAANLHPTYQSIPICHWELLSLVLDVVTSRYSEVFASLARKLPSRLRHDPIIYIVFHWRASGASRWGRIGIIVIWSEQQYHSQMLQSFS
jgi:hypothetical protein